MIYISNEKEISVCDTGILVNNKAISDVSKCFMWPKSKLNATEPQYTNSNVVMAIACCQFKIL